MIKLSEADKDFLSEVMEIPVVETFHSIQGEGAWTGASAFFIRLGGCDVGCSWCDTKHSWSAHRHPHKKLAELVIEAATSNPKFVVVTGGEPLMHNLTALTDQLHQAGLSIHLETSGAHPLSGSFDWITCSPKPFKPPQGSIYPYISELKVVIANSRDLEWAELQATKVPASTVKLLQPEWNSPDSHSLVFNYVLQHPEWRVSSQVHKLLGVR